MVGGFALARLAGDQLYGVSAADPVTYAVASVLLVTTGVLATAIPARRAALVDPDVAFHSE
jgi:putative ABC transport system permease protein